MSSKVTEPCLNRNGMYACQLDRGHLGPHECDAWGKTGTWTEPVTGSPPKPDMVNNPPHYTTGKTEVLDFIEDQKFGYLDGQVIKYVARARHKGAQVEDLKKARFYLDRLITSLGA